MKEFFKSYRFLIATLAVFIGAGWVAVTEEQYFQAPIRINATPFLSVPISYSHNTSTVTAFAGGGTGATSLTKEYNVVSVVATALDSVKLPTAYNGSHAVVSNTDSADALAVYPPTSGSIDGGTTTTGYLVIPAGDTVEFWGTSATAWKSSHKAPAFQSATFGAATAGTTQTQAGATALTKTFNKVTTGNANDGVALPGGLQPMCVMVSNISANALKVYGANADNDTIDGGSADASVTQAASAKSIWYCTTDGVAWTSFQ